LIKGKVVDERGESIPGANILLVGTYDGTTTDGTGSFTFRTDEKGTKTVLVKFVGYKEFSQTVVLEGREILVSAELKEEINELEAVTISAGAFTASDAARRTVFKPVDIATTAGATADIAGALNTLPGTQKVGETGRLFVRGGDGYEAKTFIDGMVVHEAYGASAPNTPSRGRFLPFMFKGTSFSTGGYSAEFGQALSSALVLDSKDESELTRTDIGLLSVGGDVAHTQAWDRGSVAGKVQYTNIRPYFGMINQEVDWKRAPASIEGVAAFRQRIGKDGIVKFYGNYNNADFAIYNHSIDDYGVKSPFDLTNKYRYLNSFYKTTLDGNWSLRGGLSYTSVRNFVQLDKFAIDELQRGWHGKAVIEGNISNHAEVKTGVEVLNRSYDKSFTIGGTNRFNENIAAAFAEIDVYASNNFVTRAGGRIEYNSLQKSFSVDPRISLAYKVDKLSQFSFAFGTFRQSGKNEVVLLNTGLQSEKSTHYILNFQRIENNRTFRIETFYKDYSNLVKYVAEDVTNTGTGYAKGVEVFWRDNGSVPRLDYWVSYSLLDTKRNYLQFPHEAVPSFASRHNFSIVGKYFVQSLKSQIGMTYSFTSGRPYNDPNAETFNGARTPSYQDLSLNWSYLPKPYLIVYFSCTNLLGHDNIFGYEYSSNLNAEGRYNGRPIRQAAPRFVFIGIFLTLSKNKSMNQLPTL
jgi:hypothetical protein